MIPPINIRHDMNGLAAQIGLLAKERAAASVRSINRSMSTVRAESGRTLGAEYPGLRIGAIKARIAFVKASKVTPAARLTFSNSRLRLMNWRLGRVQTPYGTGIRPGKLPAQILRVDAVSGRVSAVQPGDLKSAFLQRTRRGGANVWLRQTKASMPIDVLVTPSLSEVLVAKRINQAMAKRARERFAVVFAQEAKFQLSRRK